MSITPTLMEKALDYASQFTPISAQDREIIFNTKKAVLINNNEVWHKKNNPFTITMGSYDGAECCELIGLYLLNIINKKLRGNFGLYRDDGLCTLKATPKEIEQTKKQLCQIFNEHQLKITVEANLKTVKYLDVNLNLVTGKHSPFTKPNNITQDVHSKSDHPPQILKNIPEAINLYR